MKAMSKFNIMSIIVVSMFIMSITKCYSAGINLLSTNTVGKGSGGYSPIITKNGRFVIFESRGGLLKNDFNNETDIYVRDLLKNETKLITIDRKGEAIRSHSSPILSENGRYVIFTSYAPNIVLNDINDQRDTFVYDLNTGIIQLVTVNRFGKSIGDQWSGSFSVSTDGRFVAFQGYATDFVSNDTNKTYDIFVRDIIAKTTQLVSINNRQKDSGNAASSKPLISPNGRFVMFESEADDLVANDNDGTTNIFVRDLKTKKTRLLKGTASGNHFSEHPVFSANSRYIVYYSNANNVVANDKNNSYDLFLYDLLSNKTKLISMNRFGKASGGVLYYHLLSANSRYVLFDSIANDLVANDTNNSSDVFVRDLITNKTKLISVNMAGKSSIDSISHGIRFSKDGQAVIFTSYADDLVKNDTSSSWYDNYFIRNLKTNKTTLFNIDRMGKVVSDFRNYDSSLEFTPDNKFVVFSSQAWNLVPHDNNKNTDVFIKNLQTGVTKLISMNKNNSNSGRGGSMDSVLSADGKTVIFESTADDLVPNQVNDQANIYSYRIR